MFNKIKTSLAALAVVATLAGCSATSVAGSETSETVATSSSTAPSETTTNTTDTTSTSDAVNELMAANQESHYSAQDAEYDASQAVAIELTGTSATSSGDGVSIDGSTVTITAAGTYEITGDLSDGQVVVDAEGEDVQLVLNGVELTSTTGSPLVVNAADEVTLILADGSTTTVSDATSYSDTADDAPNAAIYSMADLSIAGSGSLSVSGNFNDGIVSKDGLEIAAGNVTVEATDDGIRGKDYVRISGGNISVTAGGDGIKSDNETDADRGYVYLTGGTVAIAAGDDGFKGYNDAVIVGGELTISTSYEGIEAQAIAIAGGTNNITADDDGINVSGDAAQWVDIAGGTTTIDAGGDGFDSNSVATMSDGTLIVHGPTGSGNGAIDVDGDFTVTGGTLWAVGAAGMAQTPAQSSTQGFVYASLSGSATGEVKILDADGNEVGNLASDKAFQAIVYSSADIASDASYEITLDGTSLGTVSANEYATGMNPGGGGGNGRR